MPIAKVQLPDGRIARFEVAEGTTPEQVTAFANQNLNKIQPAQEEDPEATKRNKFEKNFQSVQAQNQELLGLGRSILGGVKQAGEAALEIGPGLGELASGGAQRVAESIGREDISKQIGERVAKEREGLTTAQKVGRGAGQIIGTLPVGGSGISGVIKGAAALSALTPTEEGTKEAAIKQIGTGTAAGVATFGLFKGAGASVNKAKQLGQDALKRVKSGIGAKNVEQLEAGTVALKEKSSKLYEELRNLNSDINKKAGTKLVTELDNTLAESGKLNKKLHGDTMSVVKDIQADAMGGKVSLEALDQHRQNLGAVIKKNTDTISGQVNADGQKATVLIDKLDDLVDKLGAKDLGGSSLKAKELLTEARKDWKVYSKFQRIANLAEKADGDPNRIKALFQQFVSKKKNLKGFTKDEVVSLRFAAENTGGEKLLKTFGKFGFDFGSSATAGNTALPALSLFTGGIAGAPLGGGLAVTGGTAARQLQKLIARGKVEDALDLIQKGGFDENFIKKLPPKVKDTILNKALSLGVTQQAIQDD